MKNVTKRYLVILVLILATQHGFGQIGFYENFIANTEFSIQDPNILTLGDIDGDGDIDMLTGSSEANRIHWFENTNSLGNYGDKQAIGSPSDTFNVKIIKLYDFDFDGDLDVIFASPNKIGCFKNIDGLGNFGNLEVIISASNLSHFNFGDMDNDGDLDIVTSEDFELLWYENTDGQGDFVFSNVISSINLLSRDIDLTDVDGDGNIDIIAKATTGSSSAISWYKNINNNGNFNENYIGNVNAWEIEDMDNDGDIDIFSSSGIIFENTDGLGNFQPNNIDNTSAWFIKLLDFDNDGFIDILINDTSSNMVKWSKNIDGLGNFDTFQTLATENDIYGDFDVADADNDGNYDIFTVDKDRDLVGWNRFNQLSFEEFKPISKLNYIRNVNTVCPSDIDGDGDLDIICAANGELISIENLDGQGNFDFKKLIRHNTSFYAETFDLDNDGDLDILLKTKATSGKLYWYENLDGQGNFGGSQIIENNGSSAKNVKAADFDNDGDLDVLSASYGFNEAAIYFNIDGAGTFDQAQPLGINNARYCFPGDIDGDGDKDIIVADNNELFLLENLDGYGNFGNQNSLAIVMDWLLNIKVKDFDNDGDIDILFLQNELIAGSIESKVMWLENIDGLGNFSVEQIIITSFSEESFDIGDFDNDGDLDIICSNSDINDYLGWYEHLDGNGNFSNVRKVIQPGDGFNHNSYNTVVSSDLDADGDIDVISGVGYKLSFYENLGILGNEINGNVYLDSNSNGCSNFNSHVLNNIQISANNGSEIFTSYTKLGSGFQVPVNAGNFSTSVSSSLPNYFLVNPLTYNSNFTGTGNIDSIDFCIGFAGLHDDMNISISPPIDEPRPGFDTSYQIIYSNIGTTQISGDITFQFDDSKIQFLNASESVASQTSNSLSFDYTDLNPFETRTIDLDFNVFPPPTTNIDDELISIVTINPTAGDETQDDNTFTLEQTVIGSYDPNDIQILEGDQVHIDDADEYLHFLIRFQNTGTASAINVRVEHILDSKLDWTTMQLQSLSHDGRVEITDGSDVQFIFNNINLPDQTSDEEGSNGYIAFKIKPKDDVILGDIISGVADIYFDFNPPIITNTATTEFVDNLSDESFSQSEISVYPNPTNGLLYINSKYSIETIEVFNILGKRVLSKECGTTQTEFDLSPLQMGIYLVKVKLSGSFVTKKIVKE